ncbi:hypothetical protein IMG5_166520 [Ichthyophthirius multifiliis]|uniref:Uncharacterized protein n=1 Tax=Ichthyophthirius multifiliis TaxID=5932 RepID=G0R0S0_ICHMU|nr:hypothetical protein IMG5_166520 [Ichthyophthirius multifiliis]EGR28932.1 hypothetical protein IMG5_166520 [Ichthyophthirius multifiliis]|eukprot:XP_004030168.1 hypothetical protein IMG5_166520 [Ichthyophthirius multifiliis]
MNQIKQKKHINIYKTKQKIYNNNGVFLNKNIKIDYIKNKNYKNIQLTEQKNKYQMKKISKIMNFKLDQIISKKTVLYRVFNQNMILIILNLLQNNIFQQMQL